VAAGLVGAAVAEAVARVRKICVDAVDPGALGPWWAGVLDLEWRPERSKTDGEGGLYPAGDQPRIWFNRVPEPKTVKHRWHFDIYTRSLDDLTAVGATVVWPEGDDRRWTVMADPEGGEFCAFLRDPPEPRLHGLVVDCAAPAALARWWVGLLGGTAVDSSPQHTEVSGVPGMPYTFDFVKVPEPKTVKNRIHLDLTVDDVARLVEAGATVLRGGDFTVLADPEGNELCAFPAR
jgi:hypothetical protein